MREKKEWTKSKKIQTKCYYMRPGCIRWRKSQWFQCSATILWIIVCFFPHSDLIYSSFKLTEAVPNEWFWIFYSQLANCWCKQVSRAPAYIQIRTKHIALHYNRKVISFIASSTNNNLCCHFLIVHFVRLW